MDSRTAKNATHESDDMEFFLKHEIHYLKNLK